MASMWYSQANNLILFIILHKIETGSYFLNLYLNFLPEDNLYLTKKNRASKISMTL
jgi:hypothetical protein